MTTDTPEKLDELTPHQLIDEVKQIAEQYAAEVPGVRRNWPESLRARILALGRLGIPKKRIADLTGIPAATVFLWCRGMPAKRKGLSGGFLELRRDTPTVRLTQLAPTVGLESISERLSLRAPNGFVFDGLRSTEDLIRLYQGLSR